MKHFLIHPVTGSLAAVVASATMLTCVINPEDFMLGLILPGVSWGLALTLPIFRYLDDRRSIAIFTAFACTLWWLMLLLASNLGILLVLWDPVYLFSLLGALSGWLSYLLYNRFVIYYFRTKDAAFAALAGYAAFALAGETWPLDEAVLGGYPLHIFYWQLFVGATHIYAFWRNDRIRSRMGTLSG